MYPTTITRKFIAVRSFMLLLVCTLQVNELVAEEYSFSQAFQQLVVNNDALAASHRNVDKAKYIQQATRHLDMPSINISASYVQLNEAVSITPSSLLDSMAEGSQLMSLLASTGSSLGISSHQLDTAFASQITDDSVVTSSLNILWPLYTGGRITAAQDIAKAQTLEAGLLLELERQSQFEKLAKVYFGVVLAQQVLQTRVEAQKNLQKHRDHAVKLEEQGQIAKVETLKAAASYDTAIVEVKKARRDLEMTQVALKRMLKQDQLPQPSDELFISPRLPLMESFIQDTLSHYPGLGVMDAKATQASGLIAVEKGKSYPEVFLFGNYQLYEEDTLASELNPDWLVGIGVKIPLLDRNGHSKKIRAARSTLMQIKHLKAQAVQDLSLLVEKTWRGAQMAQEEYTGLQSSLVLAKENVRLREKAFAQGLSTSLEVVDAELFLTSIKNRRSVAAYQYVVALAQLLTMSNNLDNFTEYQSMRENEIHYE